jgi:tRNA-specific adenosine deaminase 1
MRTISEYENFGDFVASLVLDQYGRLPLKGKPHGDEWTVLAGIVESDSRGIVILFSFLSQLTENTHRVVALGTGNKCIEQSMKTTRGDALMDSHAEVNILYFSFIPISKF